MSDRPQPTMNRLEDKIAWYNPKSIASKKNYRLRQGAQLVAFEVSSVGVLPWVCFIEYSPQDRHSSDWSFGPTFATAT